VVGRVSGDQAKWKTALRRGGLARAAKGAAARVDRASNVPSAPRTSWRALSSLAALKWSALLRNLKRNDDVKFHIHTYH
jgi:hypothetical protein